MINITMIICLSAIAVALVIANAKEQIEDKRIKFFKEEEEKRRKSRDELLAKLEKELAESFGGKDEHNK